MIDLFVVGGGPAGLATAIMGAQAGMQVVVAEPRPGPIDKACGEGLMPAAVDRLRRLDVPVAGSPFLGIRYLRGAWAAEARFRSGPGLGVRRTTLHSALALRAKELGVSTMGIRVDSVLQQEDRVIVNGFPARYLVAADGLHSVVRRELGVPPATVSNPRYGLRRHYNVKPWSDLVEVYWSADSEAYVTPVADDLVGVAILGTGKESFDSRLLKFPALMAHLDGAEAATSVRGAGPLLQRHRTRVSGNVLFVGDASGYVDALTGEGISLALAEANALVRCLVAGRPAAYEHAWRQVSRRYRYLTSTLLWARRQPMLGQSIVPAARILPGVFTSIVNQLAAG